MSTPLRSKCMYFCRRMSSLDANSINSKLIRMILESEKPNQEKEKLLVQLQEKELKSKFENFEEKEKLLVQLQEKELKEIESKFENFEEKEKLLVQLQEKELKSKFENFEKQQKLYIEIIEGLKERNQSLAKEKERETVYKLHYQQLLTVRAVIEMYEKNFGTALLKKNISRKSKWVEFLSSSPEMFKPFKAAGFTVEEVSSLVDTVYKTHSADIHAVQAIEGFVLETRGLLTNPQIKIVALIISNSPWKDFITISIQ